MAQNQGTQRTEAARLKAPSWKDPKLLIGVLLVLLSVVGVVFLVNAAKNTSSYYALKTDLAAGSPLSAENLTVVEANLGTQAENYLPATQDIPSNSVLQRFVKAGDLLAKDVMTSGEEMDRKPFGLIVEDPLASTVTSGDTVDVWVSLPGEDRQFQDPVRLIERAEIAEINRGDTGFSSTTKTTVQLLLPDNQLPAIIKAVNSQARISLVPSVKAAS